MRIGALIIVVSLFGYPARSQRPVEVAGKTAIRVLIVDGFSNHDWKRTTWASGMGHLWKGDVYPVSYRSIDFQTTLIRATEWLATGEVTYPVPPNFPTAGATSLRAEGDIPGDRQPR